MGRGLKRREKVSQPQKLFDDEDDTKFERDK